MVEIFVYFVLKNIARKFYYAELYEYQKFAPPKITRYTVVVSKYIIMRCINAGMQECFPHFWALILRHTHLARQVPAY